ncbi:MAG: 1-deoxy-D-xylulose-5-phosphate synthase [Deltaproteobacteria bacterium]|nr:1-deoxy-D-xylulose-5-phosphate synthase [Deltaproteobacteria bacterium]MBW2018425.1 1-deoxy-D-xylulose-5-phosphate synthase [Deltaproteobacteria bacterium]MBW2073712.1 1-deoxy-D-xylulose-5-phosphate synthase [Deltaproteobacteria bacterium]RLB83661.1 MAG: 1-deoxy-D-xylulose-5-phosphate synthase [Deltaproteobacteria bacterium]
MKYLNQINSPEDLKRLQRSELPELAREIRKVIIETVSRTGGHLAPSLGVVELTIALHYVFDASKDKIIWDVGHQAYAHKLLTGRRDRFHTLRQYGGLSGFTRMSESPYDAFSTGHASTSISAGLGIASGKCLKKDPAKIVAVIGDGSMTGGLAYEGLNQAGDLQKDLIVVLNDNEMSIARNVGVLSSFLSRKLSAKYFMDLREELKDFLKSLPKFGDDVYNLAKRTEESFKAFITPGMLFEAFKFYYFGPIKGHRLDHLIDTLQNVKKMHKPILLHVTTKKGKGYPPAERNPTYFHGVGSFEITTGNGISSREKPPTYTEVFGNTLVELARENDRIVAVTAAMPEGTGLKAFSEAFPERFFDVGIAEQHAVTFAGGMATEGFRPVVAIYSTFLQRAYDQILHDVCLEKHPVVFAMDRGGIVGEDGPTHHGLFDFSYLRNLPNMVVMAPKDENELRHMLMTALEHPGPIAFRYPRGCGTGVSLDNEIHTLPIGKGEVLTTGADVLIVAIGVTVIAALEAQKQLKEQNISATVINSRFVKPLDAELITRFAKEIPYILTVEENVLHGGFGSAVLECLADAGVTARRVVRLGIPDAFVEHGSQEILRSKYGVDAPAIVKAVKDMVGSLSR